MSYFKAVEKASGRPYFILVEFDESSKKWSMEFGDYNKAVVKSELEDKRSGGVKTKNLRIIQTGENQADIDKTMSELNNKETASIGYLTKLEKAYAETANSSYSFEDFTALLSNYFDVPVKSRDQKLWAGESLTAAEKETILSNFLFSSEEDTGLEMVELLPKFKKVKTVGEFYDLYIKLMVTAKKRK